MTTDYIKRIQTRASKRGIKVSREQVREVFYQVAETPMAPTEEEIQEILTKLDTPSTETVEIEAVSIEKASEPLVITEVPMMIETQSEVTEDTGRLAVASPQSDLASIERQDNSQQLAQLETLLNAKYGDNPAITNMVIERVSGEAFENLQEFQRLLDEIEAFELEMTADILNQFLSNSKRNSSKTQEIFLNALNSRQEASQAFFDLSRNRLNLMRMAIKR